MVKIKLLIATSLLMLLVPILDKRIRPSAPNLISNQQDITTKTANEISQIIKPVEATYQQVENAQTPAGFCLDMPILMYHHVQPQNIASEKWQTALNVDTVVFESQMAYLANTGYQTVSLEQLARALVNHEKFPPKGIALTFDDGYRDFYTYAFPIIKKYNLSANLFIATGLVENPDYLTWNQLGEMVSNGQIFAYNHTWSHANLASASQAKMESEVQTAQKQLTDHLGITSKIFAYPYGQVSQNLINYLSQNGFSLAVSTTQGRNQCQANIFSLPRIRIGNSHLSSYGL